MMVPPALRLPRKVRVGIIGMEGHVDQVVRPLPELPDVELAAYVHNKDLDRPFFKNAKRFSTAKEMLDSEKLDVVAVATDDGARAAAILECASRKVNVFAEKPLATTKADLAKVKQAVAKNGIRLGMMLELRFAPHFLALREIVQSGQIGEVAQIQGQKSYKPGVSSGWRNKRESYSGTIPWVGIHMADLMLYTSGRRFVECASFQTRIGWPELGVRENSAAVLFQMDNGGAATLSMDYLRPDTAEVHDDDRLRLAGTKGVAEYMRATGVTLMTTTEKPRVMTLPPKKEIFVDFLGHVYAGKPTLLPIEDIWRANDVVLAARDAANTGKVVKLGA